MTAEAQPGAVLALFERGKHDAGALLEASELAQRRGARLMVATLVWQRGRAKCCGGPSPYVIGCAIREEANAGLLEARAMLGSAGERAEFHVVAGDPEPPLASWVAGAGVDVVFVPRRRLARRRRWVARKLRAQSVDVRLSLG